MATRVMRWLNRGAAWTLAGTGAGLLISALGMGMTEGQPLTAALAPGPHLPFSADGPVSQPAGSPRVLFSDLSAPGNRDVFDIDLTGQGRRLRQGLPGLDEFDPDMAPDGRRFAFVGGADTPEGETVTTVFVTPGDALPRQVSPGPADGDPTWAPDGSRVLYASQHEGRSAIVSVAPDGADARALVQIERENEALEHPAISPNGARVAFVLVRDGEGDLWHVASDGADPAPLLVHPGWDDRDPAWSPEGDLVAFASRRNPDDTYSLWLLDVATGVHGVVHGQPGTDLIEPSWGPGGTYLVYRRGSPDNPAGALERKDLVGRPTHLTSGGAPDVFSSVDTVPSPTLGSGTPDTPVATPTESGTATPTPPDPTFPPPPPSPRPFPTRGTAEPTTSGPAPTYPLPSATPAASNTASPTGTPAPTETAAPTDARIFLPATTNRHTMVAPVTPTMEAAP